MKEDKDVSYPVIPDSDKNEKYPVSIGDHQMPYKGNDPYIFVSYSHKDMGEAMGIISRLQSSHYRIWYDEGIVPGTEWDENIASHVEGCSFFIALMSNNYLSSSNCKDELNYARDMEKPRLLIYLEDVQLPGGMRMRLNRLQAIYKNMYHEEAQFYEKLFSAKGIDNCLDSINSSTPSPKQENSIKAQSFEDNIKTIFPIKNDTASSTSAIKYLPDGNIEFGHYPQGKKGDIKPIEWQILDRKDNRLLVISRYGLDCQKYDGTLADITWETCSLRTWLNGTFINNAFSTGEKELISSVTVSADRNPYYSTSPGNCTTDKVFLLSITEAEKYFKSDPARQCKPTEYVKVQGVYVDPDDGNCWWWLRSPGSDANNAADVYSDGIVHTYGSDVGTSDYAVRPAMWIEWQDPHGDWNRYFNELYGDTSGNSKSAEVSEFNDLSLREESRQVKTITKNESAFKASLIKYLPDGNIEFGHYPQGKKGEIKPIEWQILDRKDNRILVISRYALDCQQYNSTRTNTTWEKCSLRTWLNGTFINNAFSTGEKELIPSVTVSAERNPEYSTSAGNSTTDKVFLLSITEANKYFRNDTNRACKPTEYAKAQGAHTYDNGNCWWWLRSPGYRSIGAANVFHFGHAGTLGSYVDTSTRAVRPALWINLES